MILENVPAGTAEEIDQVKAELLKIFGPMGGATARAEDFGRILPGCHPDAVREALEALAEAGSVDVASLSDGVAIYHFIRR